MAVCSRDTQGHCVPSAAHAQAWCGLTATPSPTSSSLLLISAPDRTMWFLHPAHNLLCCAVPSLLRVLGDALHPAAAFLAHPPPRISPFPSVIPLYLPGPPSRANHPFIGPLLSKCSLCFAKQGLLLHAARVTGTSPVPFSRLRIASWHPPSSSSPGMDGEGHMCSPFCRRCCPLPPEPPVAMPKDPIPIFPLCIRASFIPPPSSSLPSPDT